MKTITVIEAYQARLISQKMYTKLHNDIAKMITDSGDRLLDWYIVDAMTVVEIVHKYDERKELSGKNVPNRTYCRLCEIMDKSSKRV